MTKFCRNCQVETERYASGNCKPCSRAIAKAYYAENRDKFVAYYAENRDKYSAYYAANREKFVAYSTAWRAANPGRKRAHDATYRANNLESRRINRQNYDARKRENGGTLSKGLADKLFSLQRGKCACCKLPLGDDYHLDHIIPISMGGPNIDKNIQLLRARCNISKHAKHPIEFMQQRGLLL